MIRIGKLIDCVIALGFCVLMLLICKSAEAQVLPEYNAFPKASVGVQVGTQGFGLQGNYNFWGAFNVRAGFNTIPDLELKYNGRQILFNRTAVYAMADWQPQYGSSEWFASKWFVSAGMSYAFSNWIYRQGLVGTVPSYTVNFAKLRSYIGTGLGNLSLYNKVRMRADLGYYIPLQSATSDYSEGVARATNGWKGLLPGLNAALTVYYKF